MVILGITMGINSSCCLMVNGKIVAAQQEERFRRIKNYDTWPGLAIKSCLEIGNLNTNQIVPNNVQKGIEYNLNTH